jgi:4-amino-4-deoxy-L-arabinose transferase-like glycosyltransferase
MPRLMVTPKYNFTWAAVLLLTVCAVAWAYCVGLYPSFYWDDPFFAFPAYKAALGRPFVYVVSSTAPFADKLWGYHGPLYPHLLIPLFRIFGYSRWVARAPGFLGGWLAVLLMVWFLNRRGYRVAGLILAILWCGDRATQEILYARMDGVALLFLAGAYILMVRLLEKGTAGAAFAGGVLFGLSVLSNPICILMAGAAMLLVVVLQRWRSALWLSAGLLANAPLLLWLWQWHPRESGMQFWWHAHRLGQESAVQSIVNFFQTLRWSRYWQLALILFTLWGIGRAFMFIWKRKVPEGFEAELLIAAAFSAAALTMIFRSSTHPYYIVYFSLWPMLSLAVLAERYWPRARVVGVVMALIWCSSALWNAMRLREAVMFHRELGSKFLQDEINRDVPAESELIVSPRLYSIPIEARHQNFDLTTWFPEKQDICPTCYVLMVKEDLDSSDYQYVAPDNLLRRHILYQGPTYPHAGALEMPVVLYSPEIGANPGH